MNSDINNSREYRIAHTLIFIICAILVSFIYYILEIIFYKKYYYALSVSVYFLLRNIISIFVFYKYLNVIKKYLALNKMFIIFLLCFGIDFIFYCILHRYDYLYYAKTYLTFTVFPFFIYSIFCYISEKCNHIFNILNNFAFFKFVKFALVFLIYYISGYIILIILQILAVDFYIDNLVFIFPLGVTLNPFKFILGLYITPHLLSNSSFYQKTIAQHTQKIMNICIFIDCLIFLSLFFITGIPFIPGLVFNFSLTWSFLPFYLVNKHVL